MAHMPINHRLLGLWRTLSALAGAYVLGFGIVGLTATWDTPFFGRQSTWVLGLRTNLAFSVLSVLVGAVVFAGALVGGNLDRRVNLMGGIVFLVAGIVMMTLMQTSLNLLNFTMATCIVSFLIGLVLLTTGLYGQVGPPHRRHAEEAYRHGGVDPMGHVWQREQEQPHRPVEPDEADLHRFA